jgi:mitochondrial fission protein ELM1
MLRLKGRSQAKVVTCMTPEPLLSSKIDLCLVPHHDQPAQRTNIFVTIGPPGLPPRKRQDDARQVLILVGGRDEKSHTWQTDVLVRQIETLIRRATGCLWTITSSPRTPDECERRLQVVADEHPQVTFFRAKDTAPGWVEEAYARHASAWVTADSISMIYEALTAGCRVGILPVKWKSAHNKFQRSIDFLARQQLVLTYERWLNDAADVPQHAVIDEAARCAKEILKRWWPERLR